MARNLSRFLVLLLKRSFGFSHGQQLTVPAVFLLCTFVWNFVTGVWSVDSFKDNPLNPLFPALATFGLFLIVMIVNAARDLHTELIAQAAIEKQSVKILTQFGTEIETKVVSPVPSISMASVFIAVVILLEVVLTRSAIPDFPSPPKPAPPRPPEIKRQIPPAPLPSDPDVSLRLVYPHSPALMLVNTSDAIAREIKYAVAIWNKDAPERNDPLPIPVATFDWIKAHSEGGPQDLFGGQVAALINKGNHLSGSITVNCPECKRGHTFAVSIVWGENGWFSEIKSAHGSLVVPTNFAKEYRDPYFLELESMIPESSRIPIGPSPMVPFKRPGN
jgi:hypothetical protein